MKKIVTLMLLSVCVSLSAETISSVSYNPSRSGTYSNLKAADRITFLGGLEISTLLNVASTATFRWKNGTGTYQANALSGTGKLSFGNATVQGYNLQSWNGAANTDPTFKPGDNSDVKFTLAGGAATFSDVSYVGDIDSPAEAGTLSKSNRGKMRFFIHDVNLPANSTLTVFGTSNSDDPAKDLVGDSGTNEGATRFFRLVGGDIPDPATVPVGTLSWCSVDACTAAGCGESQKTQVQVLCYKNTP